MLFKKKESRKPEMIKILSDLMFEYLKNCSGEEDEAIPLFDGAKNVILNLPDKDIIKVLKTQDICLEAAVWNIAQNYAMQNIKAASPTEFMLNDDAAKNLYLWINEKKYEKSYITDRQREDNAELAEKLSIQPPFGMWL